MGILEQADAKGSIETQNTASVGIQERRHHHRTVVPDRPRELKGAADEPVEGRDVGDDTRRHRPVGQPADEELPVIGQRPSDVYLRDGRHEPGLPGGAEPDPKRHPRAGEPGPIPLSR